MSEKTRFIQTASWGIMTFLGQELNIHPYQEYMPEARDSIRVFPLRLGGLNAHYLNKMLSMQDRLTMAAGLDEDTPVRVTYSEYGLIIEIPKPRHLHKTFTLEALGRKRYIERSGPVATVGVGVDNLPVKINYTQPATVHTALASLTGYGKTNTQMLLAWNLAHHSTEKMLILDTAKKGVDWSQFDNVANLLHPVVTEVAEADRVLAWIDREINLRAERGKRDDRSYNSPKIFVFVDELKDLIDDSRVAQDYFKRIARLGRQFGLHLVLATQYPQPAILGKEASEIIKNCNIRLCGKVDDPNSAYNTLGVKQSGADALKDVGDFLLRDANNDLKRVAIPKIEPHHIRMLKRAEVQALELPDSDIVNDGPSPSRHEPMCVEPEQAALALIEPMGIGRFRDRVIELGLAETFSKDRAKRTLEFAEAQRVWIRNNNPRPKKGNVSTAIAFDFLDSKWIEI